MLIVWGIVYASLLLLAIEDFRHYKVSVVLLVAWVLLSAIINFPFALDVWYSLLLLLFLYSALKLINVKMPVGNLALGDWVFLIGLAFHVSFITFVWLTIFSHFIGVVFILLRRFAYRYKTLKPQTEKAPMVTMYVGVFFVHQILLWTK